MAGLSRPPRLRFLSVMNCPQPRLRRIGLGSFPFARRYLGNRLFFLFLQVLRCFSSLGLPSYTYFIQYTILDVNQVSFLIRTSADLSLFATTRSFSQLITSFIGSWCHGIPMRSFLLDLSVFFSLFK